MHNPSINTSSSVYTGQASNQKVFAPRAKKLVTAPKKTLILLGAQGSGKGTQGENLMKEFDYKKFETGQVLRNQAHRIVHVKEMSVSLQAIVSVNPPLLSQEVARVLGCSVDELGQKLVEAPDQKMKVQMNDIHIPIGEIQSIGGMVPKEVVMELVGEFMANQGPDARIMFDGIPRTLEQNEELETQLDQAGRLDETYMLLIKITRETALANIRYRGVLTGRSDDANEAAVANRLDTFYRDTEPIADVYDKRGRLIVVDGTPPIDLNKAAEVYQHKKAIEKRGDYMGRGAELSAANASWNRIDTQVQGSVSAVYERVLNQLASN